jgi:hypothetical protein
MPAIKGGTIGQSWGCFLLINQLIFSYLLLVLRAKWLSLVIDNQQDMPVFKDHKVNINHLLGFIPEALIAHLSATTRIDHYTKVLHGKKMFYLLMYGILENDRLSQRTLEDSFNDPVFKMLFNLDENETVRRSFISDRLSKMEPDYFKQLYECIYDQFSALYSSVEKEK